MPAKFSKIMIETIQQMKCKILQLTDSGFDRWTSMRRHHLSIVKPFAFPRENAITDPIPGLHTVSNENTRYRLRQRSRSYCSGKGCLEIHQKTAILRQKDDQRTYKVKCPCSDLKSFGGVNANCRSRLPYSYDKKHAIVPHWMLCCRRPGSLVKNKRYSAFMYILSHVLMQPFANCILPSI